MIINDTNSLLSIDYLRRIYNILNNNLFVIEMVACNGMKVFTSMLAVCVSPTAALLTTVSGRLVKTITVQYIILGTCYLYCHLG